MTRYVVMASWDSVPHLSEDAKKELLGAYLPHERDARSKGIPSLGAGAIYPVPESEVFIDPIILPAYWPRAYALDVGWNRTAALWGCYDPDADTVYFYSEHYRSQAEPSIHAAAIQSRGKWIPGVIDPAARGRGQKDGERLFQLYLDLGLKLSPAKNSVEAGLLEVWQRLSTGRLKFFKTLGNSLMEYRIYRRDEKGAVVKAMDHLMDCTRYFCMSGLQTAIVNPAVFRTGRNARPQEAYDPFAEYYR